MFCTCRLHYTEAREPLHISRKLCLLAPPPPRPSRITFRYAAARSQKCRPAGPGDRLHGATTVGTGFLFAAAFSPTMFPLQVGRLLNKPLPLTLLCSYNSSPQYILMVSLAVSDISPSIFFPSWSRSLSLTFSFHFHVRNIIWSYLYVHFWNVSIPPHFICYFPSKVFTFRCYFLRFHHFYLIPSVLLLTFQYLP